VKKTCTGKLGTGQEFPNAENHRNQQRIVGKVVHKNCADAKVFLLADITIDLPGIFEFVKES
jgi:hypothetical protein